VFDERNALVGIPATHGDENGLGRWQAGMKEPPLHADNQNGTTDGHGWAQIWGAEEFSEEPNFGDAVFFSVVF